MQHDHEQGMDMAPDSVSYNTALAAIEGMGVMTYDEGDLIFCDYHVSSNLRVEEKWSSEEATAYELVQQMKRTCFLAELSVLPGLQRSLLKLCASKGNATAALGFVDDIQALSNRLFCSSEPSKDDKLLSSLFDGSLDTLNDSIYTPTVLTEFTDTNDSRYVHWDEGRRLEASFDCSFQVGPLASLLGYTPVLASFS